jgi:hypothetical protein
MEGLGGICFSTKGTKTKIWYIPVYRKGFENKINSEFLSDHKFSYHYLFLIPDFIKSSFLFGHFIETQKFAIYTAIQIVHIA